MAAHGCNTHTQRAAVQAARSRRDRFASPGLLTAALQLRVNGQALSRPKAVGRPRQTAIAEGVLKTQPTGGRAEQAYKHRARDAGEMADLRHYQNGRRSWPGSPLRPGAARHRGTWVHRTPAFRAPSDLFRARKSAE